MKCLTSVILTLVLSVTHMRGQQTPYCTQPTGVSPGPNDPPFPSLPRSFQTRVEANILEQNYTISATEYVDYDMNRAAFYTRFNGDTETMIFNYAANEVYYVRDLQCFVSSNISADANNVIFGDVINPGYSIPHVYTTSGVLHFAKQFGEVYMGQSTVRGILVDHWRTCMYWPKLQSNFTLDYYFSRSSWNTSDGFSQVPVRAVATGVITVIAATPTTAAVTTNFSHYYDYFDFREDPIDQDQTVYETPPGIVCPGRRKMRDVPVLKGQYRYREEIISPDDETVTESDVWYDYDYGLVRYDIRFDEYTPPYYTGDAITEIHDYNTGVSYGIDKLLKNCTIMPIENGSWDAFRNTSQMYLKQRNPQQIFFLDSSYEYAGRRKVRNVPCDTFIGNRSDFEIPGFGKARTAFTIYFMTSDWANQNTVGADNDSPDVPMRLEISGLNVYYYVVYDFFNFDQEHPNLLKNFDISPCFSDSEKINFRLTLPAPSGTDFMKTYKVVFMDYCLLAIAEAAHVSALRIQNARASWDSDNIYFSATLLEKPPPIAKYSRSVVKVSQTQNDRVIQQVDDAYTCAVQCDSTTDFDCNSFDFCGPQGVCTLSKSYTSNGAVVDNTAQCDHYTRVLGGVAEKENSLQDAWLLFRDLVFKGGVIVTFNIPTGQTETLKASDVTDKVLLNPQRKPTSALTHFIGQTNKKVKGFEDAIFTGDSIDDCANLCQNEIVFTCQSFEYCFDSGYCILSRMHPDDRPDLVQQSDSCDLYIRDYTAKYTQTPGTTVLSSSDTIYQAIYSENQCAKLCNDYKEFPCKSFDYCPDINTCFLGRQHIFDVPKANIKQNPTCSHYSRTYIDDFLQKSYKIVSMQDDRVVVGVSPDQCAKMCVEEETFQCASFDYCDNMTECRLSTADMRNVGQVTLENSASCNVYQRQYYPNGQQFLGTAAPQTGYSSGSMAGLAVAMIVVGLLLGIVCVIGFMKFRSQSNDGMTIAFTNREHVPE